MRTNEFRTIRARYPGTCARCGNRFPKGTSIRYGKGRSYHLAKECTLSNKPDERDDFRYVKGALSEDDAFGDSEEREVNAVTTSLLAMAQELADRLPA